MHCVSLAILRPTHLPDAEAKAGKGKAQKKLYRRALGFICCEYVCIGLYVWKGDSLAQKIYMAKDRHFGSPATRAETRKQDDFNKKIDGSLGDLGVELKRRSRERKPQSILNHVKALEASETFLEMLDKEERNRAEAQERSRT